jgi:protoporphyrinogen oxidase
MNAGVAYQLLKDFPADPKFRTLRNGFSALTNVLAKHIPMEKIILNTTVNNIKKGEA